MQDDDPVLVAFGEFVRAQRRLAQVSQRNLARMSGVSDSYLSQIERGNYRPSPQVVKALALAFGLKPEQLYTMLGFMESDGADPGQASSRHRLAPGARAEGRADPRLSFVPRGNLTHDAISLRVDISRLLRHHLLLATFAGPTGRRLRGDSHADRQDR